MSWEVRTMQSKTSCFNGTVFRKTLSRCWPLWAATTLVLIFLLPVGLLDQYRFDGYGMTLDLALRSYTLSSAASLAPLACLLGLVFGWATFSFLFNKRGTGLMASLPVRREGLFCSSLLAGVVMLLSAGLLAAVLGAVVTLLRGVHDLTAVAAWFGIWTLESLTMYAIGVFCAMLTGSALVLIPLYALVSFGGIVLGLLLQRMALLLLVGVPRDGTLAAFEWLGWLSPCWRMSFNVMVSDSIWDLQWKMHLIYFAAAAALTVGSLLLFKRRPMECAQEPVTSKRLGQALKYIVTFYCALGFPTFIALMFGGGTTSAVGLVLLVGLGAVIGYLISEMILRKSVQVLKTSWKGMLVTAAVACLVVGAMKLDVFGYVHRVPAPEKVERAEVTAWIQTSAEIEDADALQALTELHRDLIEVQEPDGFGALDLQITYHMKDGSTLRRAYVVPDNGSPDDYGGRLRALLKRSDVTDFSLVPRHAPKAEVIEFAEISWTEALEGEPDGELYTGEYASYQLSTTQALDLFENAILPDLEAGAFQSWAIGDYEITYPSDPKISFSLSWPDTGTQYLCYVITPEATHTLAWLAAHGYEIPGLE